GAGQAHGTSAQPPARVSARLRRSLRVRRTYHVDLSSRTAVGWRLDLWCLLGKVPQDQERSSATSSSATGTDWPPSRSQGIVRFDPGTRPPAASTFAARRAIRCGAWPSTSSNRGLIV